MSWGLLDFKHVVVNVLREVIGRLKVTLSGRPITKTVQSGLNLIGVFPNLSTVTLASMR